MSESAEMFLQFVRPYWGRMHRVARRYVVGEHDAADLVQEVLLRAWRSYSPAEEKTYRRAWLFVILRNVAAEWHRASQRRIRLVPVSHSELTELAPADLSEPFAPLPVMGEERFREFLGDELAGALGRLQPAYREVVILSVAGDLNYREIAEVLDCPMGTVMSRMARARRALREALATSQGKPAGSRCHKEIRCHRESQS